MIFREATQADIDEVAATTISRGNKESPKVVKWTFCLEHEGRALGVGGFWLMTPTTAWCWLDLAEESHEHIYRAYRVIKEWIDKWEKDMGITRLMAAVRMDFPEAIRTVEHLGFEPEGIMRRYYGEKDAVLYVRLSEKGGA